MINVYIDGSSKGNPGPGGAGIVIYQDNAIFSMHGIGLGHVTNNQAEFLALKHVLSQCINCLSLLIHDLVIFEQVFPYFKIVFFDLFLRPFDRFRNHRVLDCHTLFHPEGFQKGAHTLRGEDTH